MQNVTQSLTVSEANVRRENFNEQTEGEMQKKKHCGQRQKKVCGGGHCARAEGMWQRKKLQLQKNMVF